MKDIKKSTGLFANPKYYGNENHELFNGDNIQFKESGEVLEVRWWESKGCWAGYNREKNRMIMLYKILNMVRKI